MGADLLPIGMITDVSAGALGGGGGVLPFSGQSEVAGAFQSFLQAGDAGAADGVPAQVGGDGSLVANLSAASSENPLDGSSSFSGDIGLAIPAVGDATALGDGDAAQALTDAGFLDAVAGSGLTLPEKGEGAADELLLAEPEVVQDGADVVTDSIDVVAAEAGYVPVPIIDEAAIATDSDLAKALEGAGTPDSGSADDVLEAGLARGPGRAEAPKPLGELPLGANFQTPSADPLGSGDVGAAPQRSVVDANSIGAAAGLGPDASTGAIPAGVQTAAAPAETAVAASGPAKNASDVAVGLSDGTGQPKVSVNEALVPAAIETGAGQLDDSTAFQSQVSGDPEKPGANVSGSNDVGQVEAKPRRWKTNLPEIARATATASQPETGASSGVGGADATPKADGALLVGSASSEGVDVSVPDDKSANGNPQVTNAGGDAAATQKAAEALNASAASKSSGATRSGAVDQEFSEILSDADAEAMADEAEADIQSRQMSTAKSDGTEKNVSPGSTPAASEKQVRDGNIMTAAIVAAATNAATDDEVADDDTMSLSLAAKPLSSIDAAGTARSDAGQASVRAQTTPAAVQVAGAIAHNLKNGHTRFQMRFDPPELGRVDVHMKMSADGSVNAHLVVERPETLDMFLRDQRALERALVSAGLNTEGDGLQFSLQDNGSQGFGSSQYENEGGARDTGIGVAGVEDGDETLIQVSDVYLNESQSGLDIRI